MEAGRQCLQDMGILPKSVVTLALTLCVAGSLAQQGASGTPGPRTPAVPHKQKSTHSARRNGSLTPRPVTTLPQSSQATPAPSVEAAPPPPPTPAQMPAVPANVVFQDGLLTIAAENSTLADVLTQVRAKTGANIDVPPGAASQRVVMHAGPLPPRDALAALLNGSGFDYVIVGSEQDPQSVQRVILSPHHNGAVRASGMVAPARQPTGDPDVEEVPSENVPPPPPTQPQQTVQPRSMPPQGTPGAGPQTANPGDSQQVKTPQQLLEELQRLQQQRQQQQNQQNPPPQQPQVPR